jgi:hypothetical protein
MKGGLVEAAVLLGPAGMEVEGPEICWRSVMDVYILLIRCRGFCSFIG